MGGTMSPEARILGFVVLMMAIFLGAYKAGSLLGPVIPANAPVHSPGNGVPPAMHMSAPQPGVRPGTP
jgi:hypothetical protein